MANFKEYDLDIISLKNDEYSVLVQAYFDTEGNKHFSHNEVGFNAIYKDGQLTILGGWHIGTEDFEWSADEDGKFYLNEYHNGVMEQLTKQLQSEQSGQLGE